MRVEEDFSSQCRKIYRKERAVLGEKWTYEKRSSPTPYPRPVRQFRVQYSVYSNTHTRHAHSTRARKAHTDDISPSLAFARKWARFSSLSCRPSSLFRSLSLSFSLSLPALALSLARSYIVRKLWGPKAALRPCCAAAVQGGPTPVQMTGVAAATARLAPPPSPPPPPQPPS